MPEAKKTAAPKKTAPKKASAVERVFMLRGWRERGEGPHAPELVYRARSFYILPAEQARVYRDAGLCRYDGQTTEQTLKDMSLGRLHDLCEQMRVDVQTVPGTGEDGGVVKADLVRALLMKLEG